METISAIVKRAEKRLRHSHDTGSVVKLYKNDIRNYLNRKQEENLISEEFKIELIEFFDSLVQIKGAIK